MDLKNTQNFSLFLKIILFYSPKEMFCLNPILRFYMKIKGESVYILKETHLTKSEQALENWKSIHNHTQE